MIYVFMISLFSSGTKDVKLAMSRKAETRAMFLSRDQRLKLIAAAAEVLSKVGLVPGPGERSRDDQPNPLADLASDLRENSRRWFAIL